ncbi:DUF2335 domain-containing protein [bacterium BS0013]
MTAGPLDPGNGVNAIPPQARAQILERTAQALEGFVPPEKRDEAARRVLASMKMSVQVQQTAFAAQYSGKIPPPQMLAEYDRILPGMTERILVMAEQSQQAEIDSVKDINRRTDRYQLSSLIAGFIGLIIILGFAYVLAMAGHDWVAGAALGIGVSGIIATLVNAPFASRHGRPDEGPAQSTDNQVSG